MSLNTVKLKQDLKDLYEASQNDTGTAEENLEAFLSAFVTALEGFVKSGAVIYIDGLTAGANPVVGTFNGKIE